LKDGRDVLVVHARVAPLCGLFVVIIVMVVVVKVVVVVVGGGEGRQEDERGQRLERRHRVARVGPPPSPGHDCPPRCLGNPSPLLD